MLRRRVGRKWGEEPALATGCSSYLVVVSQDFRQRQLELARRMTYLELNTDPAYMEQYTGALFLPHTDPARFPSVPAGLRRGLRWPTNFPDPRPAH